MKAIKTTYTDAELRAAVEEGVASRRAMERHLRRPREADGPAVTSITGERVALLDVRG